MKRDQVVEKELGAPKIERQPDLESESPRVAKKSVNEMLAEMSMADQKLDSNEPLGCMSIVSVWRTLQSWKCSSNRVELIL